MTNLTNLIEIDGLVDLVLLDKQRAELHGLMVKNPEACDSDSELWGLLEFLDHICQKYGTATYED